MLRIAMAALLWRAAAAMIDTRTDLCARADAVANGSLPLEDALRGVTLSVGVLQGNASWIALVQDDDAWARREADGSWRGYHFALLDALSASAGFEVCVVSRERRGVAFGGYADRSDAGGDRSHS